MTKMRLVQRKHFGLCWKTPHLVLYEERVLDLMSRVDLRALVADPRDCEVALIPKSARDVSLCRFINPLFSIDYIYIFTPSDGW